MTAETRSARWLVLLWWVLASVVSYTIGFPLGLALGKSLLWGWLVGGGNAAAWQWFILRHRLDQAGWWIAVSLVGLFVGTALSFWTSQIVIQVLGLTAAFISVGATVGLSIGIAQWIMLRAQIGHSGWWVLASGAGYSLGILAAVNAPVVIPVGGAIIFGPEFGGLVGIISGVFTGITMIWLLGKHVSAPLSQGGRSTHEVEA